MARDIANIIALVFSKEIDGIIKIDSISMHEVASHQMESEWVLRLRKWLETIGAKVLGTVLTKVQVDRKGDDGYQYYEYNSEESQKRHKK